MKYLDLIYMLDLLSRYYPRYHSSEIFLLADDILKWINNELPHDSSTLHYLQSIYDSPAYRTQINLERNSIICRAVYLN